MKLYRCPKCGNMVAMIEEHTCIPHCCGEPMKELVAGTTDAAVEKHVPEYVVKDGIVEVTVGAVEHPMIPEHYIEWISLQTKQGNQRKVLSPEDKPEACFALCEGDSPVAAYEWCNLHGLWKKVSE